MSRTATCGFAALALAGCDKSASSPDLAGQLSAAVGHPVEIRLIGEKVIDGQPVTCGLYGPTPATLPSAAWPGAFASVGGRIVVDAAARGNASAVGRLRSFGYREANPIP